MEFKDKETKSITHTILDFNLEGVKKHTNMRNRYFSQTTQVVTTFAITYPHFLTLQIIYKNLHCVIKSPYTERGTPEAENIDPS